MMKITGDFATAIGGVSIAIVSIPIAVVPVAIAVSIAISTVSIAAMFVGAQDRRWRLHLVNAHATGRMIHAKANEKSFVAEDLFASSQRQCVVEACKLIVDI